MEDVLSRNTNKIHKLCSQNAVRLLQFKGVLSWIWRQNHNCFEQFIERILCKCSSCKRYYLFSQCSLIFGVNRYILGGVFAKNTSLETKFPRLSALEMFRLWTYFSQIPLPDMIYLFRRRQVPNLSMINLKILGYLLDYFTSIFVFLLITWHLGSTFYTPNNIKSAKMPRCSIRHGQKSRVLLNCRLEPFHIRFSYELCCYRRPYGDWNVEQQMFLYFYLCLKCKVG